MPDIRILPLGSGQDVGRSCVVVTLNNRNIMFDCGMHLGFRDHRRFPDFTLLSRSHNYTDVIDAVLITHFHLDHVGALPYFTEVCGYRGPIYMTYPTKAVAPVMLEDFHKIMSERAGDRELFMRRHIQDCMNRVTAVDLHQTVQIDPQCRFCSYYAGHVLGAVMFHLQVGDQSVVYTGDYNMTPERHLAAASIERLRPDVLITESTYATTLRDSKRGRERDFLTAVHETVSAGGKVLVPVFAVGRAQEMLILLDGFWERMNLQVPIYMSGGMSSRANLFYRLMVGWSSPHMREQRESAFAFKRMKPWDKTLTDAPGPCVLFATPGMLHGGVSLEVFKAWAGGAQNLVILPGYQVAGTLGSKLMAGQTQGLQIDKNTKIDVNCQVRVLSFSAHADAKGILQLVQHVAPRHVVLVHGEAAKMEFLKAQIRQSLGLPCDAPANATVLTIPAASDHVHSGPAGTPTAPHAAGAAAGEPTVPPPGPLVVQVEAKLLQQCVRDNELVQQFERARPVVLEEGEAPEEEPPLAAPTPLLSAPITGILIHRAAPVLPQSATPAAAAAPVEDASLTTSRDPLPPPPPPPHMSSSAGMPEHVPPAAVDTHPAGELSPVLLPPCLLDPSTSKRDSRQQNGHGTASTMDLALLSPSLTAASLGLPTFALSFSCDVALNANASCSGSATAVKVSGAAVSDCAAAFDGPQLAGRSTFTAASTSSALETSHVAKRHRAGSGSTGDEQAASGSGTAVNDAVVAAAATALQELCGPHEAVACCAGQVDVRSFHAELVTCQLSDASGVAPLTAGAALQTDAQGPPSGGGLVLRCSWMQCDAQLAEQCIAALNRLSLNGGGNLAMQ